MFSGIVQSMGEVCQLEFQESNLIIWIKSDFAPSLYTDQSISHNGVCLTVEEIKDNTYKVTAIAETLKKTTLSSLKQGDKVNLEKSLTPSSLMDGHLVQGHVDTIGKCIEKTDKGGSHEFTFEYPSEFFHLLVEKGSVCINGTSLTVYNCQGNRFSVSIIPYTYSHTNFKDLNAGDNVNIEFDIIGKYLARYLQQRMPS